MKKSSKPVKLPKTLGACADRLGDIKDTKNELTKDYQAEVGPLDEERKALETKLIEELPASDAQGIAGKHRRATVVTKRIPQLDDWDAFLKFVLKTKSYDLLSRGFDAEAVQLRWEAGKPVVGVKGFTIKKISLTKV